MAGGLSVGVPESGLLENDIYTRPIPTCEDAQVLRVCHMLTAILAKEWKRAPGRPGALWVLLQGVMSAGRRWMPRAMGETRSGKSNDMGRGGGRREEVQSWFWPTLRLRGDFDFRDPSPCRAAAVRTTEATSAACRSDR